MATKERESEKAPSRRISRKRIAKVEEALNSLQEFGIVHVHNGWSAELTPESKKTQAVIDGAKQTLEFITGESDGIPFLEDKGIKL